MEEGENYLKIMKILSRDEKFSRRMERCIIDITIDTGMDFFDILDFLQFSAEREILELDISFDWNGFRRSITNKLRKKH